MSNHDDDPTRQPSVPAWATAVRPGQFDARVINHEFWIDAQANIRHLDELTTEHLCAIVDMLAARSLVLYGAELMNTFLRDVSAFEQGGATGEQLARSLGQPTLADLEPLDWLETTVLLRAIRRVLRLRD